MSINPDFTSEVNLVSEEPSIVELVPPTLNKIAIIIDGTVVDFLQCDDRFAAIMLSSPTIIDLTHKVDDNTNVMGWKYDVETNTLTEYRGE